MCATITTMEQKMDKHISEFDKYVQTYDLTDSSIDRKWTHSKRVSDVAAEIANSEKLLPEDVYLAQVIGLLHDIARFEQWTTLKIFQDSDKFNHSTVGAKMLFDDKLVDRFAIDEKHYNTIRFAVANHGLFKIVYTDDTHAMMHAKLVRDADKLDLFYQIIINTLPLANFEYSGDGASLPVVTGHINREMVHNKDVRTPLDRALMQLAWAYDLNFDYSKKLYVSKYLDDIVASYSEILNESDLKVLQTFANTQKEFL